MRAVVQRVQSASVEAEGKVVGSIGRGLHIYLGVDREDSASDAASLADKVAGLRVFQDEQGKLNRDIADIGGEVLVVSAFTVCADARKGRRPSFDSAASADKALELYERFCAELAVRGLAVERGIFGADMRVHTANDGPVCILLDSRRVF